MNEWETALKLLPRRYWDRRCRETVCMAEELRLRCGQAMTAVIRGREYPLPGEEIREEELYRVLEKATGASLHTAAPAMANGYVACGGLRIGLCGTPVLQGGQVCGFRQYSSLAIRIPGERRGILGGIWPALRRENSRSVLILSPPGGGKTTALRELIRLYSSDGVRVGVVDERGEIAAVTDGKPQYALGGCCDVLSGVPKAAGGMMLLRGMNPQIIAMDEITQPEDLQGLRTVSGCGVGILATVHAASPEELSLRPAFRALLDEGMFDEMIVISLCGGERRYERRRCRE